MGERRPANSAREKQLAASDDMPPIHGTVDVNIPAEVLWREFTKGSYWPRWNKCFFWCRNKTLQPGRQLIWCFEPIKWWMLYKFPAIARIDEVEAKGPNRKVTWEVVSLPGFYARHTYSVEDLGKGRSRFGSWEKACGWNFRLMRRFWLAHFTFVKDESLEGARLLEQSYKKSGELDAGSLPKRSYILFWFVTLFLAVVVAGAAWFYFSYVRLTAQQLAPGVYAVFGGGSNSLVVENDGKRLVVDTKFGTGSGALNSWLAKNLSGPVDVIVNSHYHYDHTQGNVLYPGARIVAHSKTPELMLARDGAWWRNNRTAFMPKHLVAHAEKLRIGEIEIVVESLNPAHTHGDVIVILPTLNIIATGDVVFHTYYPFFDEGREGADIPGMVRVIEKLASRFPEARFLPGHGPVASASDLMHYAAYMKRLYNTVAIAKRLGQTPDQVLSEIKTDEWPLSILPSLHNNRLTWATRNTNVRSVYRMVGPFAQKL